MSGLGGAAQLFQLKILAGDVVPEGRGASTQRQAGQEAPQAGGVTPHRAADRKQSSHRLPPLRPDPTRGAQAGRRKSSTDFRKFRRGLIASWPEEARTFRGGELAPRTPDHDPTYTLCVAGLRHLLRRKGRTPGRSLSSRSRRNARLHARPARQAEAHARRQGRALPALPSRESPSCSLFEFDVATGKTRELLTPEAAAQGRRGESVAGGKGPPRTDAHQRRRLYRLSALRGRQTDPAEPLRQTLRL